MKFIQKNLIESAEQGDFSDEDRIRAISKTDTTKGTKPNSSLSKSENEKHPSETETSNEMILGKGKEIFIGKNRVGHYENLIFTAERKYNKRFKIYGDAYGLSKQLIFELVQTGGKLIIFTLTDDERNPMFIWETTPADFQRKGIDYYNTYLKEPQLLLPKALWNKILPASVRVIR